MIAVKRVESFEEQKCLLRVNNDDWNVQLDDSIPFGIIKVPSNDDNSRFHGNWMRIGRQGCGSDDSRWVRISSIRDDCIKLSRITLWNIFGYHCSDAMMKLSVSWAILPDYVDNNAKSPVQNITRMTIRLLHDLNTIKLLRHPKYEEIVKDSLKSILKETILLDGDCLWLNLSSSSNNDNGLLRGLSIPICIENVPIESLFNINDCNIYISPHPKWIQPAPLFIHDPLLSKELCYSNLRQELLLELPQIQHGITPTITFFKGSRFICQEIILTTAHQLGIPVYMLPIENLQSLSDIPCPVIFIIPISECSPFVYHLLRKVSLLTSKQPLLIFVLSDKEPDQSLLRLIRKSFTLPILSESERKSLIPNDKKNISINSTFGLGKLEIESSLCLTRLDRIEFDDAVKIIRKQNSGGGEIPRVKWEDVAGLEEAKRILLETVECSYSIGDQSHQALHHLGRRCGILFYGPPGTGKTLLAKAVATEFNISFFSIKGPELLDIYVGESEAHIRQVFSKARMNRPCILFFDELDSLAVTRGKDGDAGGVTDRLVSQLITELDSIAWDSQGGILVIGATNRPDLLDPALLRPGRFDKRIYLGVPKTLTEQAAILRASARSYLLGVDVDFDTLAETLPKTLSPADLASICHTAMKIALGKIIKKAREVSSSILSDQPVSIEFDDLLEAATIVRPSISSER